MVVVLQESEVKKETLPSRLEETVKGLFEAVGHKPSKSFGTNTIWLANYPVCCLRLKKKLSVLV